MLFLKQQKTERSIWSSCLIIQLMFIASSTIFQTPQLQPQIQIQRTSQLREVIQIAVPAIPAAARTTVPAAMIVGTHLTAAMKRDS